MRLSKGGYSVVRREVLNKRLNRLDEYLRILNGLKRYSLSEFMKNPECYGAVERFLQLCIEAVTDIGNHLVADLELGQVNSYRDIPALLNAAGYLSKDLEEKWFRMIGFRNTLVHDYLEIDRSIVHDVLHHHLEDIEGIKHVLASFL
jgi:uncharacterized protein YutE (UPF0331/DUF86 family)